MEIDYVKMFVVFGFVLAFLLFFAILLLTGKVDIGFISGFSTMSEEKREKYDEKAVCRFVGWLMIAVCFGLFLIPIGTYFKIKWLVYFGRAFTFVILIVGCIYVNTSKRFLKDKNERKHDNPTDLN